MTPGKSAYNPEQVASMVVMAVKRAERDITKLGAAELSELRRLAAAYKDAFEGAGYDYDAVRCDIEICAMRAGLPDEGSAESFSHTTQALVEDAALSINEFTFDLYKAAAAGAAGENVFLSPYSVSTALAMTYAGGARRHRGRNGACAALRAGRPRGDGRADRFNQRRPRQRRDGQDRERDMACEGREAPARIRPARAPRLPRGAHSARLREAPRKRAQNDKQLG